MKALAKRCLDWSQYDRPLGRIYRKSGVVLIFSFSLSVTSARTYVVSGTT